MRIIGAQLLSSMLIAAMLAGCQATSQDNWTRDELYFGLSRPDGGMVSEGQFQQFVDEVITPRFPDGFTIVPAMGQYRETSGKIDHEPSRMIILYSRQSAEVDQKIDAIRTLYKQRFNQESVLLVTSPAKVKF